MRACASSIGQRTATRSRNLTRLMHVVYARGVKNSRNGQAGGFPTPSLLSTKLRLKRESKTMLATIDKTLHEDVLEELKLDPRVPAGEIGIAVERGVVTLSGTVQSFTEKWAADDVVKHVKGVRGIANEL